MRPRLTALLVLGPLAFARLPRGLLSQYVQQTERTKVCGYELGETYDEIVSPDPQKKMDTVCPQTEAQYELGATLGICRAFAVFRAGKDGEFKVSKAKLEPGIQDVTVKFQAGKVCEVSVAWALNTGDTVMVAEGIVSSHHHVVVDFVSRISRRSLS